MNKQHYTTFAANEFSNMGNLPFRAADYSKLKFGSDQVAHQFGNELADKFFEAHSELLLANDVVVIPSPYNHVPNAATVMARHFFNRLNHLMVNVNGKHAEWSIIHRKVSYISDYGFLTAEKRKALIDGDTFHLNRGFIEGKLLICIDDVKITGTHEDRLKEVLKENGIQNDAAFIYYAQFKYDGTGADIESQLNFAGIKTVDDYIDLSYEDNHHMIIRPMKFLLGLTQSSFENAIARMHPSKSVDMYQACIAEGFYTIPAYQANFKILAEQARIYM